MKVQAEIAAPKISVIVPVHNAADYLPQCLDSLKAQTLKDIECILIDDAGTDDSGRICEAYAAADARFRVVRLETNVRQGQCRNIGIEMARGEYIGFVDADDWIDAGFFEQLYNKAASKNFDAAKAMPIKVFPDGSTQEQKDLNARIKRYQNSNLPLNCYFTHEHWSAIYRADILRAHPVRYADIRNAEDDVFLFCFGTFTKTITLVPGVYYYYRQHPQSTVHRREWAYYEAIVLSFEHIIRFANAHIPSPAERKMAFRNYLNVLRYNFKDLMADQQNARHAQRFFEAALGAMAEMEDDPAWLLESLLLGSEREEAFRHLEESRIRKFLVQMAVKASPLWEQIRSARHTWLKWKK